MRSECRSLYERVSQQLDWALEETAYRTNLRHYRLIRREERREANCISGTRRLQGSRPEYIGNDHPQTSVTRDKADGAGKRTSAVDTVETR